MTAASSTALHLWLLLVVPLTFVIGLIAWVTWRDRRRAKAQTEMSAHMSGLLDKANSKLRTIVADENGRLSAAQLRDRAAMVALGALPVDVHPLKAVRVLQAALPDTSDIDKLILLRAAWKEQQRPQYLAAMAGMGLADRKGSSSGNQLAMAEAIQNAGPVLLQQIAEAVEQGPADHWVALQSPLGLEKAAERIEDDDPATAAFLLKLSEKLMPAVRARMLRLLLIRYEEWEDLIEIKPFGMVRDMAPYCHPRFPELLAAMHEILGRHEGANWQLAAVQLDQMILEHFQPSGALKHFDMEAAALRLEEAIVSPELSVAQGAAQIAASLLGDYFYDTVDYRVRLQHALDWAVAEDGMNADFEWLEQALNPPDVTAANLREAEDNMLLYMKMRSGTARLGDTTTTIDAEVALAELRHVLPDVPADMLRTVLIERWKDDGSALWLAALGGLALEALNHGWDSDNLVRLCLHWPLKAGPPELVLNLVAHLERRFDLLDGWIEREASVLELRRTVGRMEEVSPAAVAPVHAFLTRVEERRVPMLERAIQDRLARNRDDERYATQLALDVHKLCVPGKARLAGPVRDYMRARAVWPMWRSALVQFETMTVLHFGAQGQLTRYDFDVLIDLLLAGMADEDYDVAWTAETNAARLVEKGLLRRPEHLWALADRVKWALNRYERLPESYARLQAALDLAGA